MVQRSVSEDVPPVGTTVLLTAEASPQFAGQHQLRLRVTGAETASSVRGWGYLRGYVLDEHGDAVKTRRVYVRWAGVQVTTNPTPRAPRPGTAPNQRRSK
ncbi:hypothetical protein AB0M43_38320 [Longispora sp. NPDC051575]|uniref:hypothetical protein n=1 Tax=Longispora sp. NPDC051575 TaxID=3154943 RepID=UPI003420E75C